MTTLTVLCGLPGAGKSTYAEQHRTRAVVLTADAIRTHGARGDQVFGRMYGELKAALAQGRDTVVDTCALRPTDRAALQTIGNAADAQCELIVFCIPWYLCHARNAARTKPAIVDWHASRALLAKAVSSIPNEGWYRVTWIPTRLSAASFVWCSDPRQAPSPPQRPPP
jgi:predicted kinase